MFNNSTNTLDFVINSNESKKIIIEINNSRIKKGYKIANSVENKIKKLYDTKFESINQKMRLIREHGINKDKNTNKVFELLLFIYLIVLFVVDN